MDYIDRCEELAAAYGRSPLEVLHWPWVHVEEIWESYMKRQRRKSKNELALAQMGMASGLIGAVGGRTALPARPIDPPTDADDFDVPESEVTRMAMLGMPIKIVKTQSVQ